MWYKAHIDEIHRTKRCPFCEELSQLSIIDQNKHAFVVPARAPYHDDHILILPKIHKSLLHDYTVEELDSVYELLTKRETLLYTKHEELAVFLRARKILWSTGKTMDHLHRHIVPHFTIQFGGSQENSDKRMFLDDDLYREMRERLSNYIISHS